MSDDEVWWGIAWLPAGTGSMRMYGEVRDLQAQLEALGVETIREKKWWLGHVAEPGKLRGFYLRIASGEDVWTPISEGLRAVLTPEVIRLINASNERLARREE